MIIFTILGILTAIFFFIVILMSIIETRIKNRTKEKFLWNMDKVETRTGGLAHDRNRTYSEIQNKKNKKNEK
jgi:predicted membrane protein